MKKGKGRGRGASENKIWTDWVSEPEGELQIFSVRQSTLYRRRIHENWIQKSVSEYGNYPLCFIEPSSHARVTKPPGDVAVVMRRNQHLKEKNKNIWVIVLNGIKIIFTSKLPQSLKILFSLLCFFPQPEAPGCQFESSVPQDLSALTEKNKSFLQFPVFANLEPLTTLLKLPILVIHEMGVACSLAWR